MDCGKDEPTTKQEGKTNGTCKTKLNAK
jgi:hypothetical protein